MPVQPPLAALSLGAQSLEVLNSRLIECEACPRLRTYCEEIARVRRRQWRDWSYWGRPVPSFGDPRARVLIFGLAPGAHGSNRTGRPFTGDGSGNFMFPILYEAGFASQPNSESRDDGMRLTDMWISASVRCAPPANKPTPEEQRNCAHWLDEEMELLTRLKVVVCLGKIGFDAFVGYLLRVGVLTSRKGIAFSHGAEYKLPNGLHLLATYHPSLQNTNTGVLTASMFLKIFTRARSLMEEKKRLPKL
ncbi:uracil-DNA glycosylase [Acidicapsa ligni]|uniref:uracil-DNA glycosylase n=1 Tax=Acidicapsa ligni TaxID=542300 RepID=UPI0021E032D7|nr:uracil-DNA glycosylase [Acidicapsa ligni]